MPHFFRQIKGKQVIGHFADLEAQQAYFRDQQTSGLIEVDEGRPEQAAIAIARGTTAGIYVIKDGHSAPAPLTDVIAGWTQPQQSMRSLALPDTAARLLWLALESYAAAPVEIRNQEQWQDWLESCRVERLNALVQITSEQCDGFVYIRDGRMLETESIHVTGQEFRPGIPFPQTGVSWQVVLHTPKPDAQAWQYLYLRTGVSVWLSNILDHYQEIVGRRLVQLLMHNLGPIARQWDWEILEDNRIADKRFFPQISLAANAYRAFFMGIGEHMSIVVGASMTQRLLNKGFGRIQPTEQDVLQSQRLISAAFVP